MKADLRNAEDIDDDCFIPAEVYANLIAGWRGHHAEKRRRRMAAQHATGASKVAAIGAYLDLLAPHNRIAALLALVKSEPAAVFWPAFINIWPSCNKGSTNRLLPKVLRRVGPCPASYYRKYDLDRGEFFRSLPASITVYRGASRARIAGLSWTTRPVVAWHFARGHDIRVPDPVIATGVIDKLNILWATNCHDEHEILGEPRDIKVEDFQLEQFIAHIGWRIVDRVLNDHRVGAADCAFAGLKNVHPITIARAHSIAVKHIGYTPKLVRVDGIMEAPADLLYWRAVLAAVPAAKRATAAAVEQHKRCERTEKVMCDYAEKWADEESDYYGDYWGD